MQTLKIFVQSRSLKTYMVLVLSAIMDDNATKNTGKHLVLCTTRKKTMGKGSVRRPLAITPAQFNSNWDRIFQNKRNQDGTDNKSSKSVEQKNNDSYERRR